MDYYEVPLGNPERVDSNSFKLAFDTDNIGLTYRAGGEKMWFRVLTPFNELQSGVEIEVKQSPEATITFGKIPKVCYLGEKADSVGFSWTINPTCRALQLVARSDDNVLESEQVWRNGNTTIELPDDLPLGKHWVVVSVGNQTDSTQFEVRRRPLGLSDPIVRDHQMWFVEHTDGRFTFGRKNFGFNGRKSGFEASLSRDNLQAVEFHSTAQEEFRGYFLARWDRSYRGMGRGGNIEIGFVNARDAKILYRLGMSVEGYKRYPDQAFKERLTQEYLDAFPWYQRPDPSTINIKGSGWSIGMKSSIGFHGWWGSVNLSHTLRRYDDRLSIGAGYPRVPNIENASVRQGDLDIQMQFRFFSSDFLVLEAHVPSVWQEYNPSSTTKLRNAKLERQERIFSIAGVMGNIRILEKNAVLEVKLQAIDQGGPSRFKGVIGLHF